ncbi:hypothetical protein LOK49_LG15G02174 [Camellia lanceoleosa]|uniref:Uncharacterized protein n=1 Tax=Camellia lanceoleosa TaxID=1840588 RepID=A0ACC0F589_9ERIC|nr:hypothetical protein LOK49_LG15G02174 [Camellia lanceoleosa]
MVGVIKSNLPYNFDMLAQIQTLSLHYSCVLVSGRVAFDGLEATKYIYGHGMWIHYGTVTDDTKVYEVSALMIEFNE